MQLLTINLADKLISENRKALLREDSVLTRQQALDAEVAKLIGEARELAAHDESVDLMQTLGLDYKVAEAEKVQRQRGQWSHLPQERIFSRDAIKAICVRYNLRFLPSNLYKGALDEGIAPAVEELKRLNGGSLPMAPNQYYGNSTQFFIAAPAESFVLQKRPKDPLLFCALGGGRFYLVHKWGKDLGVGRLITTTISRFRWVGALALWLAIPASVLIMNHSCEGRVTAPGVFLSVFAGIVSFFVGVFVIAEANLAD